MNEWMELKVRFQIETFGGGSGRKKRGRNELEGG
jgi:hypothetical protein